MSTINSWHRGPKATLVAGAKAAAEEVERNQLVANKVTSAQYGVVLLGICSNMTEA